MSKVTWYEPIRYRWAVTENPPIALSLTAFIVVTALVLGLALYGQSPRLLGWPAAIVIAVVAGLATAYVIPYIFRFGNRTCSIDEAGITCAELVGAKWRNHQWSWEEIQHCAIKPIAVRRQKYQLLLVHTTQHEEFAMALSNEIDSHKVESAILRAGCQLLRA